MSLLSEILDSPGVSWLALEILGRAGPQVAPIFERIPLRQPPANGVDWIPVDLCATTAFLRQRIRLSECLPVLSAMITADETTRLFCPAPPEWRPVIPLLSHSLRGQGPIPERSALEVVCRLGVEAESCVLEVERFLGSDDLAPLALCALAGIGKATSTTTSFLVTAIESQDDVLIDPKFAPRSDLGCLAPFHYGTSFDLQESRQQVRDEVLPAASLALQVAAHVRPRSPELIQAALGRLADPRPEVREAAVHFLSDAITAGDIPPTAIAPRLLADPSDVVRRSAATVLSFAARDGEPARAELAALLQRGDDACRQYAARALRRAGAGDALGAALDSRDPVTRAWAAGAIVGLAQVQAVPLDANYAEAGEPPLHDQAWRRRAVEVIAETLHEPRAALRLLAVHVIGSNPASFSDLDGLLGAAAADPDEGVAFWAACFCGEEAERRAAEAIGPSEAATAASIDKLLDCMTTPGRTPFDVILLAECDMTALAQIAADTELDPIERWSAMNARARLDIR